VHLARGDMNEYGNGTAQIDNGVSLDGGFRGAEVRPGKQRQTQIDGRRVHRVERFLDSQSDVFALIQFDRSRNQSMTECFEQPPVSTLIGIGQGRTRYLAANPEVIELGALRIETSHQIAQTFPTSELGIGDAEKVGSGREMSNAMICRVAINEVLEMTERNKIQQLREHRATTIHDTASFAKVIDKDTVKKPLAISNRRNRGSCQSPRHYWVPIK
jgi:hypothetical protein